MVPNLKLLLNHSSCDKLLTDVDGLTDVVDFAYVLFLCRLRHL